jgi:hypothetical protein
MVHFVCPFSNLQTGHIWYVKKTWWLEQARIYIYWNLIIKIKMRVWCVEKEMFTGVLMWSVLVILSGLCVLTLLIDCLFVIIIYSVTVWHENININMIQNVHPRFLVGFELFNGSFSMWWFVYNCHFVWLSLLVFNHYQSVVKLIQIQICLFHCHML